MLLALYLCDSTAPRCALSNACTSNGPLKAHATVLALLASFRRTSAPTAHCVESSIMLMRAFNLKTWTSLRRIAAYTSQTIPPRPLAPLFVRHRQGRIIRFITAGAAAEPPISVRNAALVLSYCPFVATYCLGRSAPCRLEMSSTRFYIRDIASQCENVLDLANFNFEVLG